MSDSFASEGFLTIPALEVDLNLTTLNKMQVKNFEAISLLFNFIQILFTNEPLLKWHYFSPIYQRF